MAGSSALGVLGFGLGAAIQQALTIGVEKMTTRIPSQEFALLGAAFIALSLGIGTAWEIHTLKKANYSANPVATAIYNRTGRPALSTLLAVPVLNAINPTTWINLIKSVRESSFNPLVATLLVAYGGGLLVTLLNNRIAQTHPRDQLTTQAQRWLSHLPRRKPSTATAAGRPRPSSLPERQTTPRAAISAPDAPCPASPSSPAPRPGVCSAGQSPRISSSR